MNRDRNLRRSTQEDPGFPATQVLRVRNMGRIMVVSQPAVVVGHSIWEMSARGINWALTQKTR